jgi:hypothetical protein
MKQITKVVIFYTDGTFQEIEAALQESKIKLPTTIPADDMGIKQHPLMPNVGKFCVKCGSTSSVACTRYDCPNGAWPNATKVTD